MKNSKMLLLGLAALMPAAAKTFILYNFLGNYMGSTDGAYPTSLVMGQNGVLYGTTNAGGTFSAGTVFALTPGATSGGPYIETILYNFDTSSFGNPFGLVVGDHGVLYGATANNVFALSPPVSGSGTWNLTVLYTFQGGSDGSGVSGIVIGPYGVIYGATQYGGTGCSGVGCGTVFSLTPLSSGAPYTETVLYRFLGGTDGAQPLGAVTLGAAGELYGVTSGGRAPSYGNGTVFSLTPPTSSGAAWTETVIYRFKGGVDGYTPSGPLAIAYAHGADPVLYGAVPNIDYGLIYSLTNSLGKWTFTVLHLFGLNSPVGISPTEVMLGKGGVLYGTTPLGPDGTLCCGGLFSLTPPASPGAPWTLGRLAGFYGPDGDSPDAGLVFGPNGVIYGATANGGNYNAGSIFAVVPD